MALMPKNVKFRKTHRGRGKSTAFKGCNLAHGDYGLQSLEAGWITAQEIEAARVVARHFMGMLGRLYIRIFPHRNYTARPAETRMGTGKGAPDRWFADVRPGTMLFELGGVSENIAREAFRRQAHKLGVRTRFVSRRTYENFRNPE